MEKTPGRTRGFFMRRGTGGQLLRAMGASLVAFSVDFAVLALLTEAAGIHYLLSAGISFLLGTSVTIRDHRDGVGASLTLKAEVRVGIEIARADSEQ